MTATNPCYNPAAFAPDNKPLLSAPQWQFVQLYLQDCHNLPTDFPFADSQKSYNIIRSAAATFQNTTLPEAYTMANKLFNQGQTASATFEGVLGVLGSGSASKDTLVSLFKPLVESATNAQAGAKTVFDQSQTFVNTLSTQGGLLSEYKNNYINKAGGLESQIKTLEASITQERTKIQAAQSSILHDQKVINDTKYYSWIPLVGTIVALVEIITHDKDIEKQEGIIKDAIKAIQGYNATLQKDESEVAQLIYAEKFNQDQVKQINTVLPDIQKIEGVWGTIAAELGDVLGNIEKAQSKSSLEGLKCLAAVYLTTAEKEWNSVANDANDFMINFYLKPVPKS